MGILAIAWLTFKWGIGITIGVFFLGIIQVVLYVIGWHIFQSLFEKV